MLKLAMATVLAFAAALQAYGLDPSKSFSQYALSSWAHGNGLAPNSVMSIAQTSDGFLWLATEQGLIRWDGISMTTFDEQNAPELGDRFIRSLSPDPDGSLWIGTMSGIVRFQAGRFKSFRDETRNRTDVFDLCADGQGGVWFSSDRGLRHYLHGSYRVYTVADGLPSNGITGLVRAADHSLWFGTTKGLVNYRAGRFAAFADWAPLRSSSINAVGAGGHGDMWIGLSNGMIGHWTPNGAGGQIETVWSGASTRGRPVECLREDHDGTLWIAFKQAGLARLRGGSIELLGKRDGVPSNDPDWIFEDREQSLWVGWSDAGLSMLRDSKFTTFGKAEGLSSDKVLSVTGAADGGLWIGTADAGVDHLLDGRVTRLNMQNGLASNGVLGVLEQRDGTLWVGSDSGRVTQRRGLKEKILRFSKTLEPGVPAMLEDRDGAVWLAVDMPSGLTRWRHGQLQQESVPGHPVALASTPDGALWVASYQAGLIRIKDGVSHIYGLKEGMPSLALTSVYADSDGVVWAGTELSGLIRVQDGRVTCYTSRQGLFDDAVGGIAEDNRGYLWIGGSRGIWRVPKQQLNQYAQGRASAIHSEVYGYANGLRSLQTSFTARPAIWKDRQGRLWFATAAGVSMIDPAHTATNVAAPIVSIQTVQFHEQTTRSQTDPAAPSGMGTVDISFAAPSFVRTDAMQVRYRLAGGDWVAAGQRRTVSFSRLRPAHYEFEVQAANSDGIWNTQPTVIGFTVTTSFYQTEWFRVLAVLAIASATWSLYVSRVHFFKGRAQSLEEIVSKRTAELRVALEAAERARELLREQATKDSLTGLWNRRAILEILEAELGCCRAERRPFCLIMIDADRFKALNDTYGHLAGDRVLQEVSQRLRRGLRLREAVGRYGGEELVILLPDCSLTTAIKRADDLRCSIQAAPFFFANQPIQVTCSFGVAEASASRSSAEILGEADEALYAAKRAGRNCVQPSARDASVDPPGELEVAINLNTLERLSLRPQPSAGA